MNRIFIGDCRYVTRDLIAQGVKVQTCVTSPPYWGLRDYGLPPVHWPAMRYAPMAGLPEIDVPEWSGCLGLELDPLMFVGHMVEVFRLVREVLADDGTLWLNLGDSYAGARGGFQGKTGQRASRTFTARIELDKRSTGLKAKDLIGIPWMVAKALQADGWYLRQDIIWNKPNPMPESVQDRCTKAHEYVFLLSKSESYYYDSEAIKEPVSGTAHPRGNGVNPKAKLKVPSGWETGPGAHGNFHSEGRGNPKYKVKQNESFSAAVSGLVEYRNKRSVWTVVTQPYSEAHFATFPPALIEPCVLAGSRPGDIVLDPFFGSGTTGEVAERLGRQWIGIDLCPAYRQLQEKRTAQMGMPL